MITVVDRGTRRHHRARVIARRLDVVRHVWGMDPATWPWLGARGGRLAKYNFAHGGTCGCSERYERAPVKRETREAIVRAEIEAIEALGDDCALVDDIFEDGYYREGRWNDIWWDLMESVA